MEYPRKSAETHEVRTQKMTKKILLTAAALALAALGQAADMETYRPDEPSGTSTGYITSKVDGKKYRVAIANFGMQDAAPARKFGRSLVRAGYNSGQAEAEIWRAAWQRYPNDRFFARCFAQQAEQAYANAVK